MRTLSLDTTLLDRVRDGHHRLLDLVSELEPRHFHAPSRLPGWSRAHVVAHLAHNAHSLAKVSSAASFGVQVDLYPDDDRDESIERDTQLDPNELVQLLATAHAGLEIVWDSLAESAWDRPVRFRDGTVLDLVLCRWRENEIHLIDLALDFTELDWSPEFCEHAIDFLTPRLAGKDVLVAPDGFDRTWMFGGASRTVRGSAQTIACWMAGRTPQKFPTCDDELPELGPWP